MSPETLAEYFEFLDDLRASGQTNMFGARPYLIRGTDVPENLAGEVLSAWMRTFDRASPAIERAKKSELSQ